MAIDYIARAEANMKRELDPDRFDAAATTMVMARHTQAGIIKYMEGMAQVMAEAAIASQKAVGDSPAVAISKWLEFVRKRALELVAEKQGTATKQLEQGIVIDQEKPDALD